LFDHALRTQLVLKGICTLEEWEDFKEDIYYDFQKDNNFTEMRASELLQNRLQMLQLVDPYIGRYFSNHHVKNKILMMTDEEIEELDKELAEEKDSLPDDMQGPIMNAPQGGEDPNEFPPEDNTAENTEDEESLTPDLDKEVDKSVVSINTKRK
jgi:integrase